MRKHIDHYNLSRLAPPMDPIERWVLGSLWAVVIILFVCMFVGCQSAAVRATIPDAQTQKSTIEAKAIVDQANINARAKVDAAKALSSPASHPITSSNLAIAKLRAAWLPVCFVAGVLFAISVGLAFTSLSVLSKIGIPVFGAVGCLAFINVIALPFLPWLLAAAALGLIALAVYEVIRHKSIGGAVQAVEAGLGLSSSAETSTVTAKVSAEVTKVTGEAQTLLSKAGTAAAPLLTEIKSTV